MKTESYLLILAIVAVISVCATEGYVLANEDTPQEEDISGIWYQIYYEGYRDGNYVSTNTENNDMSRFTINITDCSDGLFTAVYNGAVMNGTFSDNTIKFDGTYNGLNTFVNGTLIDGRLYLSTMETIGTTTVILMAVHSRTMEADFEPDWNFRNIVNNWTSDESHAMTCTGIYDSIDGTALSITEQHGPIFKGTMEQSVNNSVVTLDVYGVMSYDGSDSVYTGYAYVNNEFWTATISYDGIILGTIMTGDSGAFKDISTSVVREYSKNGTGISWKAPDIEGKVWYTSETNTTNSNGYYMTAGIGKSYSDYVMTITEQQGKLFYGTIRDGTDTYAIVGYFCGPQNAMVYDETGTIVSTLNIGDKTTIAFRSDSTLFGHLTKLVTLTPEKTTISDPTGHWYAINTTYGDVVTARYHIVSTSSSDQSYLYSLDVTSYYNGAFCGKYMGTDITGTYLNGKLSFTGSTEGRSINFEGYVRNDSTIEGITYIVDDGSRYMICTVFSDEYLKSPAYLSTYNLTEIDTWTSPDGYRFYYDGNASGNMLGKYCATYIRDNIFVGSMQQEVNGEIVSKVLYGVAFTDADGIIHAYGLDTTGLLYRFTYDGTTLLFAVIDKNDTGSNIGTVAVGIRAYAIGKDPILPMMDLNGKTWTSASFHSITSSGVRSDSGTVTLTITGQVKNAVSGTMTLEGVEYSILGYINASGDLVFAVPSDTSQLYTCVFSNNGTAMTVSCTACPAEGEAWIATLS